MKLTRKRAIVCFTGRSNLTPSLRLDHDYALDWLSHCFSAGRQLFGAQIKSNTLYSLDCVPLKLKDVVQKTFNVPS
jgi:hypothetical protein